MTLFVTLPLGLPELGISIDEATQHLPHEGVEKFASGG